jgi:hypothetical protein
MFIPQIQKKEAQDELRRAVEKYRGVGTKCWRSLNAGIMLGFISNIENYIVAYVVL